MQRALTRAGVPLRPPGRRPAVATVIADTFDELTQIMDEAAAQLRLDKKRNPPAWGLIAHRVGVVHDTARHPDEPMAQRQALIDLASASLLLGATKGRKSAR